jgi:hypothetical protein
MDQANCDECGGANLGPGQGTFDAGRNSSMSPRPAGHCDQRTHRSAVALDLSLNGDHVAGVEADGLHHVEPLAA